MSNTTQKTKTSKKAKVLNALRAGTKVTRKLAMSRFEAKNLRAIIAELRNYDGYNKNIKTAYSTTNGRKVVNYTWVGKN